MNKWQTITDMEVNQGESHRPTSRDRSFEEREGKEKGVLRGCAEAHKIIPIVSL